MFFLQKKKYTHWCDVRLPSMTVKRSSSCLQCIIELIIELKLRVCEWVFHARVDTQRCVVLLLNSIYESEELIKHTQDPQQTERTKTSSCPTWATCVTRDACVRETVHSVQLTRENAHCYCCIHSDHHHSSGKPNSQSDNKQLRPCVRFGINGKNKHHHNQRAGAVLCV